MTRMIGIPALSSAYFPPLLLHTPAFCQSKRLLLHFLLFLSFLLSCLTYPPFPSFSLLHTLPLLSIPPFSSSLHHSFPLFPYSLLPSIFHLLLSPHMIPVPLVFPHTFSSPSSRVCSSTELHLVFQTSSPLQASEVPAGAPLCASFAATHPWGWSQSSGEGGRREGRYSTAFGRLREAGGGKMGGSPSKVGDRGRMDDALVNKVN